MRDWRRLGRAGEESDAGTWGPKRDVRGHVPRILDGGGDHAEMIRGRREQMDAAGVQRPVRRLEADDAAVGGGTKDRPLRLRAERGRYHAARDRRRRSARRTARRPRGVPWILRRTRP